MTAAEAKVQEILDRQGYVVVETNQTDIRVTQQLRGAFVGKEEGRLAHPLIVVGFADAEAYREQCLRFYGRPPVSATEEYGPTVFVKATAE